MYFTEQEKRIYEPPPTRCLSSGTLYDPLSIDRQLTVVTRGRLGELVSARNAWQQDTGDVSPKGRAETAQLGAAAELELAVATRVAFKLPPFPECLDAEALEILYHFLGWMEGKGEPAGTPSNDPTEPRDTRLMYRGF